MALKDMAGRLHQERSTWEFKEELMKRADQSLHLEL